MCFSTQNMLCVYKVLVAVHFSGNIVWVCLLILDDLIWDREGPHRSYLGEIFDSEVGMGHIRDTSKVWLLFGEGGSFVVG